MDDLISRQAAIDAIDDIESEVADGDGFQYAKWREYFCDLPSAQPNLDRAKISDLLEKIYSIQSVHLSVEGVIARKYYCKQLWMELFGSEDVPTWMI